MKVGDQVYLKATVVKVGTGWTRVLVAATGDEMFAFDHEVVLPRYTDAQFNVGRNHPATSKAVEPKLRNGSFGLEVLRWFEKDLATFYSIGYTDDELEQLTNRTHQSVSAARNVLVRKGLVEARGGTRATRSGNDAIVWRRSAVKAEVTP